MPQINSKWEDIVEALIPLNLPSQKTLAVTKLDNPFCIELKTAVQHDQWLPQNPTLITYRDGLAWRGDKMYIPESLQMVVLRRCHDPKTAGHFGYLHLVRRQFWWPWMCGDIEKYVKGCPTCVTAKPWSGRLLGLLQMVANPNKPWEEIAMDFIVDLPSSYGYTVIWTVVDLFSKQAYFVPYKGIPSAWWLTDLFLHHIYRLHGIPKTIISDRGVQFTSKFWRHFICLIGSTQGLSSAFHPSTNRAAVWANAMVERYLRCYVSYQQSNWSGLLPFGKVAYNNITQRSTGLSPFQVVSGKDFSAIPELDPPSTDGDTPTGWVKKICHVWPSVKRALQKVADEYKAYANKKRADPKPFQMGDQVYLSTKYLKLWLPSRKLGPSM